MKKSYLEWLHEVTIAGYDKNVMIKTEHGTMIQKMFIDGLSPDEAVQKYIDDKIDQ